ncbi:MAG: manganese efflux pump [Bacteriovorax sp.]|jgi:putative Mn2+ efflux pump MntP|nr:manganese efflux pump [Bacteriovorax sp.]
MLSIYEIIIVGLVLSADSFSAAVAMGHRPFTKKDAYQFALTSGGAEALMTLVGALAGSMVISRFAAIDHWVGFVLLGGVALHMGYEGVVDLMSGEVKEEKCEFHSVKKVLLVSFATSLDAFGVGIGLGISKKPILPYIASIGFWAFATTIIGLYLAKKLSQKFGPIMNIFGALVLGVLAFQILKI